MAKKSSIADVAKLAGVSRTTVSYVLNNVTTIHISEKTRRRVMEAARELNYHPSAIARSLAHQQALTLGLVLCMNPDRVSTDSFLPSVIYGISSVTAPAGFRLLVETVEVADDTRPDAYISLVDEARIDGMLFSGGCTVSPQLARLRTENFPVVLWGQLPGSDLPFVDVDNVRSARTAVSHLIGLGHRRIACITNAPLEYPASANRLDGYKAALAAHDLPIDENLIRYGDFHEHSGFEAMRTLLELAEPPSAVFVASDSVALGALRAARSAGVHVPGDLALVGFDDIQLAEYIVPPLTTVRVPWREIGATLARMLLDIVQTGQRPAPVLLETELIVRESCGAHGKGGET